jgi:ABC-type phosphate/phosphonate transport system substrate-binding protein
MRPRVLPILVLIVAALVPSVMAAAGEEVFRFAFTAATAGDANPNDSRAASLLWSDCIASQIGRWSRSEAFVLKDAAEVQRAVATGQADVVAMTALEYLSIEHQVAATPRMTFEVGGAVAADYVLLVPTATQSLAEVVGKRLAIQTLAVGADVSITWLDATLADAGLPSHHMAFSTIKNVTRSGQAAMAVFFGQVDIALESRSSYEAAVELNPQLGRALKVMAQSPPFQMGVVVLRNSMDPDIARLYVEKAIHLHEWPQFKQTFIILRVTRIVPWEPRYLDTTRALLERLRAARKRMAK